MIEVLNQEAVPDTSVFYLLRLLISANVVYGTMDRLSP